MAYRNISVLLEANDTALTAGMRRASASVDEFGRRTTTAGRNVTRTGNEMTGSMSKLENVLGRVTGRALGAFAIRALGVYAAGRAVNEALTAVIGGAIEFDTRMRNVNSISYLTEQQLGSLGGQVLDLSRTLPQSANNLAEGLYDIASSGFQGAAGIQVLTASARAATAGLTDTATSAAAIAGVLNAYGKGADQARSVSDSLFQTVNLGVLSFGDLAQGIGQVVGTAAAAGVSIDDLGQAVATITKAGIQPAEAFTSLNQLLAQIIQPSEALAGVFGSLGYESGAAALQSKGLVGVMADIQRVTGGNVTTLSTLFTDIRSLRGALALTANGGKLYSDTVRDWGSAHKGAGATAKALAEQMKAVSAQWQLFKNRAQAAAIETGTHLLPALLAVLRGTGQFGNEVGAVAHDLAPTFHNIAEAVGSTLHVVLMLGSAVEPLVKVLALLAASAIISTIEALSSVLAAATGFVERHRTAQIALAIVIGTQVLPLVTALTARLAWFTGNLLAAGILRIVQGFGALAGGLSAARVAMAGLFSASISTASVLSGVFIGAAVAAGIVLYRLQKVAADARAEVGKITEGFDPTSYRQATATIRHLADAVQGSADAYNSHSRAARGAAKFGIGPAADDLANLNAGADAVAELQDQLYNTYHNANLLGTELGVAGQAVVDYAAKNNIDLSKPWGQSQAAIEQVRQGLQDLAGQAGTTLPQLLDMTNGNVEAAQALAEAVGKVTDATRQAFSSSFDVIQQFKPEDAANSIASAQETLLDAQRRLRDAQQSSTDQESTATQRLADYRAQLAGKTDITIAQEQRLRDLRAAAAADGSTQTSERQLADARRGVADATKDLAQAQQDAANTGDLATIYRNDIAAANTFVDQIHAAIRRGLAPQEVVRLLQEGPEAAAPVLSALVADHSNRLIQLANRSERALERISRQAVEAARLSALAVNSETDKLGRDLPGALRLEQGLEAAGKDGIVALSNSLHMTPSEIQRIAQEFGITLPRRIQRELDKHPVHVTVSGRLVPVHDDHHVGGFASGGRIDGPGTPTSDSILLRASRDEWVINAKAANYYGHGYMAALNKMALPRYATGGMVGSSRPVTVSGMAGPSVVVQPVIVQQSTTHQVQVGQVVAHDYRDFRAQMEADRRARRQVSR